LRRRAAGLPPGAVSAGAAWQSFGGVRADPLSVEVAAWVIHGRQPAGMILPARAIMAGWHRGRPGFPTTLDAALTMCETGSIHSFDARGVVGGLVLGRVCFLSGAHHCVAAAASPLGGVNRGRDSRPLVAVP